MTHLLRIAALTLFLLAPGVHHQPAAAQGPEAGPSADAGLVRIDSPQKGAQVWIDNQLVGPTPVSRYLSAGDHTVRVAADGYDPFVRKLTIRAGTRSDVTAPLMVGGGTVELQVNAPGGRVTIDDRAESALPVRLKDLPEGEHRYRLSAPGFEPMEGSFTFRRSQNIFIYQELVSSRGRFSISSEPPGATVMVDGDEVGVTPVDLDGVEPGLHLVQVTDGSHPAFYAVVDTSDGSRGSVVARLDKKGASVTVNTGEPEGEVLMGGVVLGTGRKVDLGRISQGRYPVEVRAPGKRPATGRLNVPASGSVSYEAKLVPEGERERSQLLEIAPFYQRWTFWTAVGVGAAGIATGSIIAVVGSQPVPIPEGDVVVPLP